MSDSLAEQLAKLSTKDREEILADLDPEKLQYDWEFWGRPEQQLPNHDDWEILLALAGRGWGKTRTGAEIIREWAKKPGMNLAIAARSASDLRSTVAEGISGILAVHPPSEMPEYKPSIRQIVWKNGSKATLLNAESPELFRGGSYHAALVDEWASWPFPASPDEVSAFQNLRIATREPGLPGGPKIFIATTPKKVQPLKDLLKEAETNKRIIIRRGTTFDNTSNLDSEYINTMSGIYGGTRLSEQELLGEMLEDVDGVLWTQEVLDGSRVYGLPSGGVPPLRIVGLDPSVSDEARDEAGIVVCGATTERELYKRHAWVLEDSTVQGPPEVWANAAVNAAQRWRCPIVVEKNQGGALIRGAIHNIDPNIQVFEVFAKAGKYLRAEPISLIYEQRRVHHVGFFPLLESQMVSWTSDDRKSPDRIDALVHALTALMIKPPPSFHGGHLTARSVANKKIPTTRMSNTGKRGAIFGSGIKKR